jgi:hypothetical protein
VNPSFLSQKELGTTTDISETKDPDSTSPLWALKLEFSLPNGSYATMAMREVLGGEGDLETGSQVMRERTEKMEREYEERKARVLMSKTESEDLKQGAEIGKVDGSGESELKVSKENAMLGKKKRSWGSREEHDESEREGKEKLRKVEGSSERRRGT